MIRLDKQLDDKPTESAISEMAELRIRNLQAFAELRSFNDTGKFLYKHPLISSQSEYSQLKKLLDKNPSEFLKQHKNVADNIKRYRSYIKREDRKSKRRSDKINLQRYRDREDLFKLILEQNK